MFNSGISSEGDLIDLAIAEGLIEKTGAWISYGQVRLGQGRENAKQFIQENPDLANEIREKILARRRPAATPASGDGKVPSETSKATAVTKEDPAAKDRGKAKPKFPPPKGKR